MKISKFTGLVKKSQYVAAIACRDEMYLTNGHAIYKAPGLPMLTREDEIGTILDLGFKDRITMSINAAVMNDPTDILGFDMTPLGEDISANTLNICAQRDGQQYAGIIYGCAEVLFYNKDYLAPLADTIKNAESYLNISVRRRKDGKPYVFLRDGMVPLAAILPVEIIDDDYIDDLETFTELCQKQLIRIHAKETEENGKQMTLQEDADE